MKKNIKQCLCMMILVFLFIYIYDSYYKIKRADDLSLIIPQYQQDQIKNELMSKSTKLISIINNDTHDGYTLGLSTPSLSKNGIKEIYDYFKDEDVCISDEQGYYDLMNKNVFDSFWDQYTHKEECSLTYYKILQTGSLERMDFYFNGHMFYVIDSILTIEENKAVVEEIYGKEIIEAYYDEYGYFWYRIAISDLMKSFGIVEYECFKIKPIGENNREYLQKYIGTIDYQCTNVFTENWNSKNIDIVNFSDLYEYLYELEYDSPFYGENTIDSLNPFIKEIPENDFEKLIQKYFTIDSDSLKKYSFYNKKNKTYLWNEAYCIPSKFETPLYIPEVIDVYHNQNIIVLTVRVYGYEFGYSDSFVHKICINNQKRGFKYISNQVDKSSSSHIPKYIPGVSCEIE